MRLNSVAADAIFLSTVETAFLPCIVCDRIEQLECNVIKILYGIILTPIKTIYIYLFFNHLFKYYYYYFLFFFYILLLLFFYDIILKANKSTKNLLALSKNFFSYKTNVIYKFKFQPGGHLGHVKIDFKQTGCHGNSWTRFIL